MDSKSFVKSVRNLPTPSSVLLKIGEVVQNPDASAADIVDILRLDPSIASKIIRLANSAYIGMPRTVSSLQNAVVILGSKRIHSLVLASELLNSVKLSSVGLFTLERFWRHSVTTALIAESISRSLKRYKDIDENEMFLGALLHDIGKLLVAQSFPDSVNNAYNKSVDEKIPFYLAEESDLHHTVVGDQLGDHWSFPGNLRAVLREHHRPSEVVVYKLEVAVIHIADITSHLIGRSIFPVERSPEISNEALATVALPVERFRVIAEGALLDAKRMDSLLEILNVSK